MVDIENVFIFDVDESKTIPLQEECGIQIASDETDLLSKVDLLILAVKPQVLPEIMATIGTSVTSDQIIMSIAAGIPIATLKQYLTNYAAIVRVMPNTPAIVGEGISAYCLEGPLKDEIKESIEMILKSCGEVLEVQETLMDTVTGLSGSGPAYMFLIIDALADGGVKMGLSKAQALRLVTQTDARGGNDGLEAMQTPCRTER